MSYTSVFLASPSSPVSTHDYPVSPSQHSYCQDEQEVVALMIPEQVSTTTVQLMVRSTLKQLPLHID